MSEFKLTEKQVEDFLKGSSSSLRGLLEPVIQKIIETKFEEFIGTKPYERLDKEIRKEYRNGTRVLCLKTACGILSVSIPQTRSGHFDTEFVSKLRLHEQALLLSIVEMSKHGVSNRNIRNITNVLCDLDISKSDVSRLSFHIKESVDKFFSRTFALEYPIVIVDAIYMSLRVSECSRKVAVFVMVGVNENGMREVLHLDIFENEGQYNWIDFFRASKKRGLRGVKWIISDAHEGIKTSVQKEFIGCVWQRCQYHFMKNVLANVPTKLKYDFTAKFQNIFTAKNREEAMQLALELGDEYSKKIPKAIEVLDSGIEDAINFLTLDKKYKNKLNTSNMIERSNKEIRRRTNAIGTFVSTQSIKNYTGSVLININERWSKRKYLDMADFYLNLKEKLKIKYTNATENNTNLKIAK